MHALIYTSSAVQPFTNEELVDLLRQSREKNLRLEITGMLLYMEGTFMQLLEGNEGMVRGLMNKIHTDLRHRDIHVLLDEPQPERSFVGWSMGFKQIDNKTATELPGYVDFMNLPLNSEIFHRTPSTALRLLRCFRQMHY